MPSETKENRPPRAVPTAATGTQKPGPAAPAGEPLACPRCESRETKFCYYNNYNLSQPRYFCKGCRRYWTHGGTLRNVPVGGGTRKSSASKRPRTAKAAAAAASQPPPPAVASPPNSASSSSSVTALTHEAEAGSVKVEGLVNPEVANGLYVGSGGFGFGFGLGLYDAGVGFQTMLGAPGMGMGYFNLLGGGGGGLPNTWQVLGDLGGEVGDSLAWPGLTISTPGDASSSK